MATEDALGLDDLPRDCLGLIVALLDPQSLGRFGAVSRTCRLLANRRLSSAEYGRALFASQARRWQGLFYPGCMMVSCGGDSGGGSGDDPNDPLIVNMSGRRWMSLVRLSQVPDRDLIMLNYRLGFLLLQPLQRRCAGQRRGGISTEVRGTPAEAAMKASGALLLGWSASFERGELGARERPPPRREALALTERDETEAARALMDLAGRWRAGYNAARACLALVSCGGAGHRSSYRAACQAFSAGMERALRSGQLTPDREILLFCVWRLANICACEMSEPWKADGFAATDWLNSVGGLGRAQSFRYGVFTDLRVNLPHLQDPPL